MQSAPSVVYPVGRSTFYAVVLAALWGLSGAALVLGWWNSQVESPANVLVGRWILGFAAWVVWGLWACWWWTRQPKGSLKWDANATSREIDVVPGVWYWISEKDAFRPLPVHPKEVYDWQSRMLLHLQGSSRMGLWLWLERAEGPLRWDDLRRALVRKR